MRGRKRQATGDLQRLPLGFFFSPAVTYTNGKIAKTS
jgi:hypothetical protein